MPKLLLTDEAHRAIRGAARSGSYKETGVRRADGTWEVPVDEDTLDRIQSHMFEGETLSDCIIRAVGNIGGLN